MSDKKNYVLNLPYWKQGTDLGSAIDHVTKDMLEDESRFEGDPKVIGIRFHADNLRSAASLLDELAEVAMVHEIEIFADTHHIGVCVEEEAVKNTIMLKEGFLILDDFGEEE